MSDPDRHSHWEGVYSTKASTDVSWFQPRPEISLDLINSTSLPPDAAMVDVGGGASTLVDNLLMEGRSTLAVLDLSGSALTQARQRLGAEAARVAWVVADVTQWRPERPVRLWHDRAVLHFLTVAADQQAYATTLRTALEPGGWAIIAGFAPGGPQKCSGLEIVQYDAASLQTLLGLGFTLKDTREETHTTPWGSAQLFRYHVFQRR